MEQERIREYGKGPGEGEADDGPAAKKPKKEASAGGFFKLEDKNNPHAYVTGLPTENFELEQFRAFMSKCGIIQENAEGEPKIKMCVHIFPVLLKLVFIKGNTAYRTGTLHRYSTDGVLNGDGRCTYLKPESVDLAITLLDQTEIVPGFKVTVARATFEAKAVSADVAAVKRKPKGKGKSDKDAKKRQEKRLLAWHDEEEKAVRKKAMGVVVIKNMFHPNEFDADATYLTDIREDLMSECGKFGVVKKIMIFDRHPEVSLNLT